MANSNTSFDRTIFRKSGWKQEEISLLVRAVESANQTGEPLRGVFEDMARSLGRKPDSIRNYYYAQLKNLDNDSRQRSTPFKPFQEDEMRDLLREILSGIASGKSVRACVIDMSGGSKARMLRYQNKYRNLVKSRPDMVSDVIHELSEQGIVVVKEKPLTQRGATLSVSKQQANTNASTNTSINNTIKEQNHMAGYDATLDKMLDGIRDLVAKAARDDLTRQLEKAQAREDMLISEVNEARGALINLRECVIPLIECVESAFTRVKRASQPEVRALIIQTESAIADVEQALIITK